jgi:hypothetical protein
MTPSNITVRFMATGISPFNQETFSVRRREARPEHRPDEHGGSPQNFEEAAISWTEQHGFPTVGPTVLVTGTVLNKVLNSLTPNLQSLERVISIWRLYACHQKHSHEMNHLKEELKSLQF